MSLKDCLAKQSAATLQDCFTKRQRFAAGGQGYVEKAIYEGPESME